MKFIIQSLFFIFLCGFFASAFCSMKIDGIYTVKDSCVFEDTFEDIYITHTGLIEGVHSQFLKLSIQGTANLDSCTMKREVISQGILNANATNFLHDLIICSGKTTLNSCNVKNIYILDEFEKDCECSIELFLKGATKVHGIISFESGKGKVYKSPNVEIMDKIIGGTLIELEE